jgi:hypothetical protein
MCIDPSEQIGDESVAKAVKKALSLRGKYDKRINPTA